MGKIINRTIITSDSLKRIGWIDNMRGFCMLAILLDHTESYYLDYHITEVSQVNKYQLACI